MKAFVDTNILIYAATKEDERKQGIALALLARQHPLELTISTQVLGEAYNVLTTRKRWARSEALAAVRHFARLHVVRPEVDTVFKGLALAAAHRLSTWDALIVQAAIEAGCDTLFSEDLQAGRRFGGLEVVNPFELAAHEALPSYAVAPGRGRPKAPATTASTTARTTSRTTLRTTAGTPGTSRKPGK